MDFGFDESEMYPCDICGEFWPMGEMYELEDGKVDCPDCMENSNNMAKNQPNCANCSMRQKYEDNPKSLAGRFWRWHIGFCPGWKQYFASLPEEEKKNLRAKYDYHKY